jgi:hypothetical protein
MAEALGAQLEHSKFEVHDVQWSLPSASVTLGGKQTGMVSSPLK